MIFLVVVFFFFKKKCIVRSLFSLQFLLNASKGISHTGRRSEKYTTRLDKNLSLVFLFFTRNIYDSSYMAYTCISFFLSFRRLQDPSRGSSSFRFTINILFPKFSDTTIVPIIIFHVKDHSISFSSNDIKKRDWF